MQAGQPLGGPERRIPRRPSGEGLCSPRKFPSICAVALVRKLGTFVSCGTGTLYATLPTLGWA
jgi:hypothetical protein